METEQMVGAAGGSLGGLIGLLVAVVMIVAMWKVFTKADQPGWAALIPIYNMYVLLKVAGKPGWWLLLFVVPIANLVVTILTYIGLAKNFGKGGGFACGLIFLPIIFVPILAFGSAQYVAEQPQAA